MKLEPLKSLIAISFTVSMAIVSIAHSQPYVEISTGSLHGGSGTTTIDCSEIFELNNGARWGSCEFYESVHGDQIFNPCPSQSEFDDQSSYYLHLMIQALNHMATGHGRCKAQYGQLLESSNRSSDADRLLGEGWQQQTQCETLDAYQACRTAIGE